ncbi:hypothetical protein OEA41_008742 [Lepraria neglecta]|uniref:Killer toxin Kp4 domain-containing protein n=1 Tax=Lepraria neglecta TaxID=209136 RepID=A0AAE0DH71_9LECA|nr:hypothetical protein OEA41_008742 [Lepraria neglecta]
MQGDHPNSYLNPITGKIVVGVDGQTIKEKVNDLYSHGCRGCGSVPIGPNNDPNSQGILTVNYVATPGCDGPNYDALPGTISDQTEDRTVEGAILLAWTASSKGLSRGTATHA